MRVRRRDTEGLPSLDLLAIRVACVGLLFVATIFLVIGLDSVRPPQSCRDYHAAQRACARGKCDAEKLERLRWQCRLDGGSTNWYAAVSRET